MKNLYMRAKTIKESISFERGLNPKKALGIGKQHIPFDTWRKLVSEALLKHVDDEDYVEAIMDFAEYWGEDKIIYKRNYSSIARYAQEIMFAYSNQKIPLKHFK
jgi:hypothetical protein